MRSLCFRWYRTMIDAAKIYGRCALITGSGKPIVAFSSSSTDLSLIRRYDRCTVGTESRKQFDMLLNGLRGGYVAEDIWSQRSCGGGS